ncbi:unnamed protein product [Effrenium voratum]|nr:unnamed protein product [Effrenium voratum]
MLALAASCLPWAYGHAGDMNEILAVMKQMENVPDPPVTWRQISKEQRCSYCRAIAGHWTEALRQKSKSLPRKLSEGEYMDTLHKACEDIPAKRLCTRMMRLCPKGSSTEF